MARTPRQSGAAGSPSPARKSTKVRSGRKRFIDYPRAGRDGFRKWIPSWKLFFGGIATAFLFMIGFFAAAVALTNVPEPNDVAKAETTIVYWDDGKTEIGRLGQANRISVPLSEVPADVQHAVLAAEDREFYNHGGFDAGAIIRAGWNNVAGGTTQGASTITQQYAKNAYLTQEQTMTRKFKELVLSVKLESSTSKDTILDHYMNTIYLGRGSYGMQTASIAYFGKPVSKLNLGEAAALASIIRAPSGYDPEGHMDKLKDRYNYVLDGMQSSGWITATQRAQAKFPKFITYKKAKNAFTGTNGYLLDAVQREMLRRGYSEDDLNLGGFRVTTTFNQDAQNAAIDAVKEEGPSDAPKGLRVGLASVRPKSGEVLALYGGDDYLKNQLSNADQAVALAGSTFKAFGLAAAAEEGISLDSTWDGSSPQDIHGYKLRNEGNHSYGRVSLLYATQQSINTAFVNLGYEVGPDKVKKAAVRAGIPPETIGLVADPTTILGTSSPTAIDMANAYATFASRGWRATPTTIRKVSRINGDVDLAPLPKPEKVFEDDVADEVNDALQAVVQGGTGTTARGLGRPAAGKTGTTDGGKSSWFVGYTPNLSTAVMMANSDKKGNAISLDGIGGLATVFGASFPAQMWTHYMTGALADTEEEDFPGGNRGHSGGQSYYNNTAPSPSSNSKKPSQKPKPSTPPAPVPSAPSTGSGSSPKPSAVPSGGGPSSPHP